MNCQVFVQIVLSLGALFRLFAHFVLLLGDILKHKISFNNSKLFLSSFAIFLEYTKHFMFILESLVNRKNTFSKLLMIFFHSFHLDKFLSIQSFNLFSSISAFIDEIHKLKSSVCRKNIYTFFVDKVYFCRFDFRIFTCVIAQTKNSYYVHIEEIKTLDRQFMSSV